MALSRSDIAALRIRVERLLRGESRPEDITSLFLAMRYYCNGRECVREIGDFAAHRDERTRGIVTRGARDFFTLVRFFYPQKPKLNLIDLPKNFSDIVSSAFRTTDNDRLRSKLGLKRAEAERALTDLLKRLTFDSQKLFLAWPTRMDSMLINCILGHLTVKSPFDDERLIQEFTATLLDNELLNKNEFKRFMTLKVLVGLYAVSQMHQCMIDLGDGTYAELSAGATLSQGKIEVNAASELPDVNPTGLVLISATFFATTIDVKAHCETDLHPTSDQDVKWKFPIELTNAGLLARLA